MPEKREVEGDRRKNGERVNNCNRGARIASLVLPRAHHSSPLAAVSHSRCRSLSCRSEPGGHRPAASADDDDDDDDDELAAAAVATVAGMGGGASLTEPARPPSLSACAPVWKPPPNSTSASTICTLPVVQSHSSCNAMMAALAKRYFCVHGTRKKETETEKSSVSGMPTSTIRYWIKNTMSSHYAPPSSRRVLAWRA